MRRLGNVRPDNTSAIIAVQQAAAVPLELQKRAFYQFVEDYVRVMIEIMSVDYGTRIVNVDEGTDGRSRASGICNAHYDDAC